MDFFVNLFAYAFLLPLVLCAGFIGFYRAVRGERPVYDTAIRLVQQEPADEQELGIGAPTEPVPQPSEQSETLRRLDEGMKFRAWCRENSKKEGSEEFLRRLRCNGL